MQQQYQNQDYNRIIIKWIDALDGAVCQAYKELGKCRIDCIYNEICDIINIVNMYLLCFLTSFLTSLFCYILYLNSCRIHKQTLTNYIIIWIRIKLIKGFFLKQ